MASTDGGTSTPSSLAVCRLMTSYESDDRHLRLLRARSERPRRRRAAEKRDEVAAVNHSMISSARASTVAGMSKPNAFAVLRLKMRSNFVTC
jgi:hypothetical protein